MPLHAWPEAEPTEVQLAAGDAHLAVDLRGGGMRRLTVGAWEVLDGYPPGGILPGRRGGVVPPWPNRLRARRWTREGQELQLDVAPPAAPNAIHGLGGWQPWTAPPEGGDTGTVGTTARPQRG